MIFSRNFNENSELSFMTWTFYIMIYAWNCYTQFLITMFLINNVFKVFLVRCDAKLCIVTSFITTLIWKLYPYKLYLKTLIVIPLHTLANLLLKFLVVLWIDFKSNQTFSDLVWNNAKHEFLIGAVTLQLAWCERQQGHQQTAMIKWPWLENSFGLSVVFIFSPRVQNIWVEIPERFRPLGDFVIDLEMLSRVAPTGTPPGLPTPTTLHFPLSHCPQATALGLQTSPWMHRAPAPPICQGPAHCPRCQRRCTSGPASPWSHAASPRCHVSFIGFVLYRDYGLLSQTWLSSKDPQARSSDHPGLGLATPTLKGF